MSKHQHVYFVTDKRSRYVKIGISSNVDKRLRDLSASSPIPLKLVLSLDFDGAGAWVYEDALHQHFAAHWLHHEWFLFAEPIKQFVDAWLNGERPELPMPQYTCKQAWNYEQQCCVTKADFMTALKKERVS
jgi:hypothetical protein